MFKLWKGYERVDEVPEKVKNQIIGELLQGKILHKFTSEFEHGIKMSMNNAYLILDKLESLNGTVSRWQSMVKEGRIIGNLDFKPEDGLHEYVKPDGTWTKEDRDKAWDKHFEETGEENWIRKLEELDPREK